MASSSSSAASAGAAIPAAPPSTLSPHAAPFTLRARQAQAQAGATPPGVGPLLQDGDASRLIDDGFALNGEDQSSYSATHFGMKLGDAVYPSGAHALHQSQPSLSCGVPASVYSSSTSTPGMVPERSATMDFPLIPGKGSNGRKGPTVTIRRPPNKHSETNLGSTSIGKLTIRESHESSEETRKDISFHRNLECGSPACGNDVSRGTVILPEELNHVLNVKPIHVPSTRASSSVSVADDMNPDPSEGSVDSPCYKGTLASRLSSFDGPHTSAAQSTKKELEAFDAELKQSSNTGQHCEAPTERQHLVYNRTTQDHFQPHPELGQSRKPGDTGVNLTTYFHGKELELVKEDAAKCNVDQKHCLEVIDQRMKSGLNSAAPDFIPSSVRKSSTSNGSCSSTGRNISGILKAIESMSEVLLNNYSDEIELEERDCNLLQSGIENLQNYLHKARKAPVKGASDNTRGLQARYSQNAVSKSVTGKGIYNGGYTADNGKSIIISDVADSSHLFGDFRKRSMTGYQQSLNNFSKELSCEEHPQALIYKSLWIDAERVNCALKYQLKQTCMEIDLESSMAHIGGGPRNPSLHLCDMGTDPSSSYGSAVTCPPVLKDHPGARKSQNLLYSGDFIHSGASSVLSRSKGYVTTPKNIQGEHLLSGLEESGAHHQQHPDLRLVLNRVHRGMDASTSDGMASLSRITGRDGIALGSCEFGYSDWEYVLKEEIDSR